MKVYFLRGKGYLSNEYAVTDSTHSVCTVIDPSVPPSEMRKIYPHLPKISSVLLTHGHFDHIMGLSDYVNEGVPVYVTKEDLCMLTDPYKNASSLFLSKNVTVENCYVNFIEDGDIIKIGDESLRVMKTPGHTAGSVCYIGNGCIFSGDMIFADGGYGRCDLYSGCYGDILKSIEKIMAMTGDFTVYPGHGNTTSLENERKYYNAE